MSFASNLIPDDGPIVVLVAHPDDEVIGVGAQLPRWRGRVMCVHATNGAPANGLDAVRAGFDSVEAYAAARRRESERALARAGISSSCLMHLPFVDQTLAYRLGELTVVMESLLQSILPAAVITHAYEGGHPDHDALSFAVAAAMARWPLDRRPRHLEFACYHEGADGRVTTNRFAAPQHASERVYVLDSAQQRAKQSLFECFDTQREILRAFTVTEERIRVAPGYDYTHPPNGGRVWYDRFNWGIDSGTWCRRAADALVRVPVSC